MHVGTFHQSRYLSYPVGRRRSTAVTIWSFHASPFHSLNGIGMQLFADPLKASGGYLAPRTSAFSMSARMALTSDGLDVLGSKL